MENIFIFVIKLLSPIGINIVSNGIYDFFIKRAFNGFLIKKAFNGISEADLVMELTKELKRNQIDLKGVEMRSKEVVRFLIDNGELRVNGSMIYSDTSIVQKTQNNGTITMKDVIHTTPTTMFKVQGPDSEAFLQGNAQIIQDQNGISITSGGNGTFVMGVRGH